MAFRGNGASVITAATISPSKQPATYVLLHNQPHPSLTSTSFLVNSCLKASGSTRLSACNIENSGDTVAAQSQHEEGQMGVCVCGALPLASASVRLLTLYTSSLCFSLMSYVN